MLDRIASRVRKLRRRGGSACLLREFGLVSLRWCGVGSLLMGAVRRTAIANVLIEAWAKNTYMGATTGGKL